MLQWLRRAGTPVLDGLYPSSGTAGRRSGRAAVVGAALLAVIAFVVSLVRQPGSALDNPWAEDGTIFLNAAYRLPWWHVLLLSYNGYVSVYPSAVAVIASSGPVKWAAAVMAIGGALAAALAALITVLASGDHLRNLPLRFLLGLAVGVFPLAGAEIAGNSCNAHWYFILATFWCLLWRPAGTPARILITAVPFVSAATDPLTGLLLPLAILRFVARPVAGSATGPRRGRRVPAALPGLGLVAGLVPQATTFLRPSLRPAAVHPALRTLLATWVYKGPELALLGPDVTRRVGWWGVAAGCVAAGAAVLLAFRGRGGPLATASLVLSAVTFVVPSYIRWLPTNGLFSSFGIQSRYCFLPWALALLVFALGAEGLLARTGRGSVSGSRVVPTVAVALLAVVICIPAAVDARTGRDRAPSWIRQVRAEHTVCAAAAARGTDRRLDVSLVVAPRASYRVRIPCSRLTDR